jgi:hypothetical protein
MIGIILILVAALMADDAVVYLEEPFETDPKGGFTSLSHLKNLSIVDDGVDGGKALRVLVRGDGHYGTSIAYQFEKAGHEEPEELFGRYYVKFGESWNPGRGGKLPGPSGTYGRAGWGGRPVDGTNGWSARMGFKRSKARDGETQVTFYTYHVDMRGQYGSNFHWNIENRGSLAKGKWYCVETYVKLNTPGKNDGILRGWIDDELAMEKTDLRFRDTPDLKIEQFWFNIYYGGKWSAPADMHIDFDSVVLSNRRIGPLGAHRSTDF